MCANNCSPSTLSHRNIDYDIRVTKFDVRTRKGGSILGGPLLATSVYWCEPFANVCVLSESENRLLVRNTTPCVVLSRFSPVPVV